jgi:hypothetical protein
MYHWHPFCAMLSSGISRTGLRSRHRVASWERYGRDARLAEIERTATLKLVSALEIPIIDVEPAFHTQRDPLALFPMRTFGHYNEEGNRLVADTILKSLPEPRIRGEVSSTFKGPAVTIGVKNRSSH